MQKKNGLLQFKDDQDHCQTLEPTGRQHPFWPWCARMGPPERAAPLLLLILVII